MTKGHTEIIQNGHPTLRKRAEEVPVRDITTRPIQKILTEMSAALATQRDGVAIAAPQINVSLRIFVVSGKVFDRENIPGDQEEAEGGASTDKAFINPIITKMSRKKEDLEEGCLSVRWLYGKIKRSEKVSVTAYDREGKKFSYSGSGLLAQIFQHEADHLDGVLFIDKATDLHEYTPEERDNRAEKITGTRS